MIIVVFVLVSVLADVLAPDPEQRQDVTRRLQGSSAEHLLGTDHTGRDFLSRNIGAVIITEASLSFLGFGLPLSVPSWVGLLSREGRHYMQQAPWLAMWSGIFLTIVVYSFNMFGDAVRDLLDPRLRGGVGRMGAHGGKALQKAVRVRSSRN